ncbi:MAG: TerB family tellurite resistance protein [Chitinophagaceae bacterium]|nr:MAG: TerB family tellurite resistance protein [Chitinophagaceae bacterium]
MIRQIKHMEKQTILEGYSDLEKGAYLGAIASIATADREATEEELGYIRELCEAANLSGEQTALIEQAATELSGEELNRCLDVLKESDLKHSLITDMIAFAKSDNNYTIEEEAGIKQVSDYLGLSEQQFSLLDQFAQKATEQPQAAQPQASSENNTNTQGPQNLFGLGGLGDKMQSAGINTGSLFKGLLSVAAPMLIGSMISRGLGGRRGGMLGGGLGGFGMGGGLGSLIGMLGGSRSFGGGGMFGNMFGRRGF